MTTVANKKRLAKLETVFSSNDLSKMTADQIEQYIFSEFARLAKSFENSDDMRAAIGEIAERYNEGPPRGSNEISRAENAMWMLDCWMADREGYERPPRPVRVCLGTEAAAAVMRRCGRYGTRATEH
jgi:hypothetical protein